jgi:hypothetical protein
MITVDRKPEPCVDQRWLSSVRESKLLKNEGSAVFRFARLQWWTLEKGGEILAMRGMFLCRMRVE